MIDDIGIKVPPKGKGEAFVSHEDFQSSAILLQLVANNTVNVDSIDQGIVRKSLDGKAVYSIPSTDIWGAGRKIQDLDDCDDDDDGPMDELKVGPKTSNKKLNRKFRVTKNSPYSISLDSIGLVLSKQVPVLTLNEDQYYDEGVQRTIASGTVVLSEILEEHISSNGDSEWLVAKTREGDYLDSLLAPKGATCVHWEGPLFDGGGYANMNRQLLFHMEEMGVHVKPTMVSTLMDVEKEVKDHLISLSHNMIPIQSPKVFATNVPNYHCGRSIGYTMMETERIIHPLLVQKLKVADELWVPCEWNRRVFENSGVCGNIRVMPLGVDHRTYHPAQQSAFFDGGTNGFTFISVFNWNWRKGFDAMLKAYIRAFTDKDDVSLVMVSKYIGQKSLSARIMKDIKECTAGERQENRPHLTLVDDVIPTFLMPRLYNSADAFCLLSRGEGWGLPYCEAASSGLPILGADHGGQQMFLNDDNATLVRPDLVVKVDKSIERISPFYHDMEFVSYSDKAINETAEKMRWMYENRDHLSEKADLCRNNILNNFTWKHAAERVARRLSEIQP
jgi:glycosyltransferase involved in cell wall biosynthesis